MKKILLPTLAIAAVLSSANSFSQTKAFAITSETKGSFNWNAVREINLTTGEVIKTHYDLQSHKNFELTNTQNARIAPTAGMDNTALMPMAEGVAAAAYDETSNRLYYTTMRGTELRYFDLNNPSGKVVYNQKERLLPTANRYDEGNVITRMAFAADGKGYALTNDGNHLIRFTTGQKTSVLDLGPLVDAQANAEVSVHSQCTSWGGDMVGDAFGNLYLITFRNHIFKINPQTRVTEHVGVVKGLPADFTSNGMAVSGDGDVVLSSANVASSYYRLNMSTLQAMAFNKTGSNIYNTSDLANSGLLFRNTTTNDVLAVESRNSNVVSVFPNPVATKVFNVKFDRLPLGNYNMVLTDALGRAVLAKAVKVSSIGQVERVTLPRGAAGGVYMLKLTGDDKNAVFNDKIVVQ